MNVSTDAIEAWFERYQHELYRHALFVLGNPHDAEDAIAETFTRAIQYYRSFEGKSSPRTWLWRILKNHLVDVRRRRQLRVQRETSVDLAGAAQAADFDRVMWEQVLCRLNFQQRQVFSLRVLQGFDTHEVAAILGCTEAKVRTVLHRARKNLQAYLTDDTEANAGGGNSHG